MIGGADDAGDDEKALKESKERHATARPDLRLLTEIAELEAQTV
jgi:hypothetical protein